MKKTSFHRVLALPFVRDRRPGDRHHTGRCFWHVEPTGDFAADLEIGERYASAYQAYLASGKRLPLGWIVADMPRGRLTGIEIGFLSLTMKLAANGGNAIGAASRSMPVPTIH